MFKRLLFILPSFIFLLISQNFLPDAYSAESKRDLGIEATGLSHDLTIEGDYWALIIGINDYANLPSDKQLQAAKPDAQAVADVLNKKYGFAKERIIELYNKEDTTRRNIIGKLRILAKTLGNKDNLMIYYAGHGEYDKDTQLGGWIPSDAILDDPSTFISNEEIRGYLKAIKARHIYTIADSCFSESLMGGKTRSIGQLSEPAIKELYNDKSRLILTSGGLYPVPDKGKGNHSTFAYYLLRILERNENKYLIPQQIIAELQPLVSNESQQTPKSAPISGIGDEGGQFVFVLASVKAPPLEDVREKEDLKFKEERKKIEEEKARLEDDMRKFREEAVKIERELKEKLDMEMREKAKKMEEERLAKEREQQKRLEEEKLRFERQKIEEQRRLEEEKRELERKKKEEKKEPAFMPPAF
jgi:hypothetical protein